MKTKEFDYIYQFEKDTAKKLNLDLLKSLIAQKPQQPRDHSRLMVLNRKTQKISHHYFYEIAKFLEKGDVLVLNNSKVFPARLYGQKIPSGGKVEILLIEPVRFSKSSFWTSQWYIIGKPKLIQNQKIFFSKNLQGEIIKDLKDKKIIQFNLSGEKLKKEINQLGVPPLPPYIKNQIPKEKAKSYYQTVYAQKIGSIAAPTAGFHFTKNLIQKLKKKGIIFKFITLHVGLGTFLPIRSEKIEEHQMLPEWVEIDKKTADFLNSAKKKQKRIIAVGTTATRALEGFTKNRKLIAGEKRVNIFIYPGYQFKFIDGMITNFHLPKSTPLLLVCAFAGKNFIFKAYKEALKKRYRFYSFGDAMLII